VRGGLLDQARARGVQRAHAEGLHAHETRAAGERQSHADPSSAPATLAGLHACARLSPLEQWLVALYEANQPPEEIARLTCLPLVEVSATPKGALLRLYGPNGDGADLPWRERVEVLTQEGLELAEIAVLLGIGLACLKKRLQRHRRGEDS
jgi:DNA-directed RNA polymerase specialized sigma24 family protein